MSKPDTPSQPERREFLTKAAAVVVGGAVVAVPTIAGLCVVFDPLRERQTGTSGPVKVATMAALPADGTPIKFSVVATEINVWNRTPDVPIGAVYLQKQKDGTVRAFNASCPHAGCAVNFRPSQGHFHCPCHDSSFGVDGKILNPKSPSARPLDDLVVEIRGESEIWVKFQNFRAGSRDKIPVG